MDSDQAKKIHEEFEEENWRIADIGELEEIAPMPMNQVFYILYVIFNHG